MSLFASPMGSFSIIPKGMILSVAGSGWCVVDRDKTTLVIDAAFECEKAGSVGDWLMEKVLSYVWLITRSGRTAFLTLTGQDSSRKTGCWTKI